MKKLFIYKSILLCSLLIILSSGCGSSTSYYDDIALVAKDESKGDYGFVNLKGEVVLDFNFNKRPAMMHEGFSFFKDDNRKIVYIKQDGEDIKTQFTKTSNFNNGLALVTKPKGKLQYIDQDLKEVITLDKNIEEAGYFFDERAKFRAKNGKWGFVDRSGNIIIKADYDYVESFSEGGAMVKKRDANDRDVVYRGIIDVNGDEIVKLDDDYKSLAGFHDGLAAYAKPNERGYINKKGEIIIKSKDWDRVYPFHDGYACVQENGDFGLIDKKGNRIIKPREEAPLMLFNDLAVYIYVNNFGFIDKNRKEKVKADYQNALPFLNKGAFVRDGNDWIYINKKNKQINDLELKKLYYRDAMENVIKTTHPFDVEETLQNQYIDIDGLMENLFKRSGIDYFGMTKNDNPEVALNYILEFLESYPESDFKKDFYKENIIEKSSSKRNYISSRENLGDYCKYNDQFEFSVKYNFDNKIIKNQEGIKSINELAKPNSINLFIGFDKRAYGEKKYIKSKMESYFSDLGYVLNSTTSVFEHDEKPTIKIKKISNGSAEILITFDQTENFIN